MSFLTWLTGKQQTVMFDSSRGFAVSATYWTAAQDSDIDDGAAVVILIANRGTSVDMGQNEIATRSAHALLDKSAVTLTRGMHGDWGTILDADGNYWEIVGIDGETAAAYKVRMERIEHDGVGKLHGRMM